MTVSELIELLKKLRQDAVVHAYDADGWYSRDVVVDSGESFVVIKGN